MLAAVVSDTHIGDALQELPLELMGILNRRQPELIIHAGDLTVPHAITQLQTIAETVAVRGDNDPTEFAGYALPDYWNDTIKGHTIVATHGHRTMEKELPSRKVNEFLARFHLRFRWWNGYFKDLYDHFSYMAPALIIGGHLHQQLKRYYKNTLIINPGAVYQSGRGMQRHADASIAFLHISLHNIEVEFVRLQIHTPAVETSTKNTRWPFEVPVQDNLCKRRLWTLSHRSRLISTQLRDAEEV